MCLKDMRGRRLTWLCGSCFTLDVLTSPNRQFAVHTGASYSCPWGMLQWTKSPFCLHTNVRKQVQFLAVCAQPTTVKIVYSKQWNESSNDQAIFIPKTECRLHKLHKLECFICFNVAKHFSLFRYRVPSSLISWWNKKDVFVNMFVHTNNAFG